jgi:hypothetical protein
MAAAAAAALSGGRAGGMRRRLSFIYCRRWSGGERAARKNSRFHFSLCSTRFFFAVEVNKRFAKKYSQNQLIDTNATIV